MDQVLKDLMLEIADLDQQAGVEGMRGEEGGRRDCGYHGEGVQSKTVRTYSCQHERTQPHRCVLLNSYMAALFTSA